MSVTTPNKTCVFQSSDFMQIPYQNTVCYIRDENVKLHHENNYIELIKAFEFLTADNFANNPHNFTADEYTYIDTIEAYQNFRDGETYTCICSCNKCHTLYPVYHIPTHTYLAVGSVCITNFINQNFYHRLRCKRHNGSCKKCNEPLCMKSSKYVTKNYTKTNQNTCNNCMETTLFMRKSNIHYFQYNKNIDFERLENVRQNIWKYTGMLPKCMSDFTLCYISVDYKYKDNVKEEFPYRIAWDSSVRSWYCQNKDKISIENFLICLKK